MLTKNGGPITFLRFGISRKKEFLKDARKSYDGLVLPANILLYQHKSTPSVIFMCDRPFFVDPMSYLFGQPFVSFKKKVEKQNPKFKPSFHKLMEGHGLVPEKFLQSDYPELLQFLLYSQENLYRFIDNTLNFQDNHVWRVIKEAQTLISEELDERNFRPSFLIPPYFLYTPEKGKNYSITTELNKKTLEYCSKTVRNKDIYPMVFITKEQLESPFLNDVINIVTKNKYPGYVVWIEDFDERFATKEQIKGLISLTYKLSSDGQQIVMLYGGFFSLLLYYFGMTCVCHGLAYGEARTISASAQENSGPAPVRYYLKDLHSFLTLENALIVLRKRPDLICSCPVCQRVMRDNPENVTRFQNEETLAEMHFLYNRYQERKMIANSTLPDVIEHLEWILELNNHIKDITKKYKTYLGLEDRAIIDPAYINNWKEALEESNHLLT